MKRGRACEDVRIAQAEELKKLIEENIAQGVAIRLADHQAQTMMFTISEWSAAYDNISEQVEVQKELFKQKIRRWVKVVVIQGAVIVILLIILI